MVIQNISSDQKTTDISFTIKRDDLEKTKQILKNNKTINYRDITYNDKVAKVSIVGAGMVSTPGVTYRMFRGLAEGKINILAISSSEIKLSVIINEENTLNAVKKLHTILNLIKMNLRPHRIIDRRKTREIKVGKVSVGGKSFISVQSMTNTLTSDNIKATIDQIHSLEKAGVDIVRVSCPDKDSTKSLKKL